MKADIFFDVVVVGGGASGLMFAVSLAKQNKNLKIAVLEALDRVGKKLAVTGNGQCNITNKNLSLEHYHGNNKDFAKSALNRFGYDYTFNFFKQLGIDIVAKEDGRAYPRSFQASSVVDAFRFECETLGINIFLNTAVTDFSKKNGIFEIDTNDKKFSSRYLIFACGLLSGGEKITYGTKGLKILENKGFKTVKLSPSLVQIKAENPNLKRLKGIKVNATATLKAGGKVIKSNTDEVLFTEYGLSGPAILQISRQAARSSEKREIYLDLIPSLSKQELFENLVYRRDCLSLRTAENFLTTVLQNRLASVMLACSNIDKLNSCQNITNDSLKLLVNNIKEFCFKVTGNTGFVHSQVCAGGISAEEVIETSMQSKKINGLFLLGELIDIDADCGGYNLAWAFASALAAAHFIAENEK